MHKYRTWTKWRIAYNIVAQSTWYILDKNIAFYLYLRFSCNNCLQHHDSLLLKNSENNRSILWSIFWSVSLEKLIPVAKKAVNKEVWHSYYNLLERPELNIHTHLVMLEAYNHIVDFVIHFLFLKINHIEIILWGTLIPMHYIMFSIFLSD